MNIKISIAIFMLLSFFNLGAISNKVANTEDSFGILENNVATMSEFKENGVKFQYKTKNSIDNEVFRTKEYLSNNIKGNYEQVSKNQFEIINKDFQINTKLWVEENYTYVEIILVNRDVKYTTKDLKNILKKLENQKLECTQYFTYYEGKCKDEGIDKDIIGEVTNENNISNINMLEINNGYTGTGNLSDGEKINFALIKYNTGSHIIIGTPIIFTTY
jgi:hypothetical protein